MPERGEGLGLSVWIEKGLIVFGKIHLVGCRFWEGCQQVVDSR